MKQPLKDKMDIYQAYLGFEFENRLKSRVKEKFDKVAKQLVNEAIEETLEEIKIQYKITNYPHRMLEVVEFILTDKRFLDG